MKIGEYKQAMSHMLKKDNSLENFSFNPDAKLIDNDPIGYATGGRVQKWAKDNYPDIDFDFEKYPKFGVGTLEKNYSTARSAITKKLNNPEYIKPSLNTYINKISDAFLKADAKDDISYLASKNKYNKNGMLSNAEVSFLSQKINSPTGVQELVDKTGLKADQILDMLDERQNFIELDLIPEMATTSKQLHSQSINKSIDQGEDWLIKNSQNYDSVKDLKKGFTRVFGQDHPLLRKSLRSSYGMPKLNPLFFEEKTKTYQSHGKPAFIYGEPEMKNLFEASLYNFNPTVRDKVLNELNDILPKEKITENQKFDLRKKFQDSEVLSEFGINKGLKGPVTRLLIKDLGDDVVNNINFIRYPRTEVGHYINYLKDKVDPKYRKQFQLVNNALTDIKYNNYNGAKQKLNIAENINFDHKVPKYLIDAGYADELEYIKLNPVGEEFNQLTKRDSFDKPMARLSREYAATKVPEEKTKIIEDMNKLKDNFNKRHDDYLSDLNIEEVNGKLNVSSSAKPITSSDELIKTLEKNVKENPELFKINSSEAESLFKINNSLSSGLNPETVKILFPDVYDEAKNGLQKFSSYVKENPTSIIKGPLKGLWEYINNPAIWLGLPAVDFVEGLTEGKTGLQSLRDAIIPEGIGHSYDIQQLLTPKEKEAQQRLGYKELPDILKEGEYGIGNPKSEEERYTPIQDIIDKYNVTKGEARSEEEIEKERKERIKDFDKEAYYGTPLMDSEVFSEQPTKNND